MKTYSYPVRIYYKDTDMGGVVYHARYLEMMEISRTEFMRDLGFGFDLLLDQEGLVIPVIHIDIDFKKPAFYNDVLDVQSSLKEVSPVKLTFENHIYRGEDLILRANVVLVSISKVNWKPKRMPTPFLERFGIQDHY